MKRGIVIAVAAGVAAVLVGGGILWWTLTRPPSAEDAAHAYLRALAEGDVDAVGEMLLDEPEGLREAFAGASDHISADYELELTEESGATGGRARVELGGEAGTVSFGLSLVEGRWRLSGEYSATLTVTTSLGDSVRIGEALVPAGEPVQVLPAVYPVTAAPAGILTGEATAVVTNEAPVEVTLSAALSPAATTLAQEQLDAYAEACTQPSSTVPANCGIRVPWAADLATLDGIAFRVERLPGVVLASDVRSFAATGGVVVATATGTTRDGTATSVTYRADDWSLRGSVALTGDEMVLQVG